MAGFVFERALGVAAYATRTLGTILDGLEVDTERMRANLDATGGLLYSSAVLLELVKGGMSREDAYAVVQAAVESSPPARAVLDILVAAARRSV